METKRFFSLQYKVLLFSFVIIIIPITILGIISFVKSSQILEQKISQSNLNTVSQIGNNIEFIIQNIRDTSLYLIQNEDVREFLKLKGDEPPEFISQKELKIRTDLMQLILPKVFINSIYIKGFNNYVLNTAITKNVIAEDTVDRAMQLRGGSMWYLDKVINYNDKTINVFSMVRVINDIDNITNQLAILKINIDENAFYNIYKDKVIGKGDDFYIIDDGALIISATDKEKIGQKFDFGIFGANTLTSGEGFFKFKSQGRVYLATYYTIHHLGWRILNIVPLEELLKENTMIQQVVFTAMIISFMICVLIAILFSNRIVSRLKKLNRQMGKLENEDFNVHIEPAGNDEITLLCGSFNKMSSKLKELILKVYSVQIKQREAELKALQSQINPHFLYNTLDNIYWMGRIEKAFETCKLVEALSKLFRLSLNSGNEITTVKAEIEHIKNYIVIQQARYKDMIKFSLHVEEDILDCITLKLVLQPLIENSIVHGIEKKGESGNIDILIRQEDGKLLFIVKDNGSGVDIEEIGNLLRKPDKENKGFAIKNVNDRIKLYFGEEYGLAFSSEGIDGTTVIVSQPYSKEDVLSDKGNDYR